MFTQISYKPTANKRNIGALILYTNSFDSNASTEGLRKSFTIQLQNYQVSDYKNIPKILIIHTRFETSYEFPITQRTQTINKV